ncbi:unnamed protein product [Adineta ricciae]|uniref:VWFA domain-containing protein n=1 Tax=Adineta ricciae TaxID=249248 RepID=A0A814V8E2_ADIRI|nr:unnamed protein product [Adineta ricciae]
MCDQLNNPGLKDHPQSYFGNAINPDDLNKLRSKFLHVWGKIGKRLCEQYDMKFVTNNTPQAAPAAFHYILLLDASGSMAGNPWNALMQAVKEFIRIRIDCGAADRITIIVFASAANYAMFNVESKAVDSGKIQFTSGGTDFTKAFDLVVKTIENVPLPTSTANAAQNLSFIIIFMTDGQASYPENELNKLLTLRTRINQFWTVAFGVAQMDLLKKINDKMGGTFKELKTLEELISVYAEIARN